MQGLKPRPGERGQQEVVQEEGGADAQPAGRVLHQPAVQQEEQVEEEERHAELDQDLSRDVPQKFPGQEPSVSSVSRRTKLQLQFQSYSNKRYDSNVAARNTAEIPQPM